MHIQALVPLLFSSAFAVASPVVTVDTLEDENDGVAVGGVSLRDALVEVDPNGAICFAPTMAGGVIRLQHGEFVIAKSLTIDATGIPCGVVVESSGTSRLFTLGNIAQVTMKGLTMRGGRATNAHGGGIHVGAYADLTLIDCTVRHCTATGNSGSAGLGGGVYLDSRSGTWSSSATLTAERTTICDNQATGGGGVGMGLNTVFNATNCTVSGNTASAGGGVEAASGAKLIFAHCTITANTGGGIRIGTPGAGSSVHHTILAGNAGGDYSSFGFPVPGGPIPSLGYNLESGTSAGFTQPTDLQNANPALGPLQDNLGLAPTHLPLPGSPAVDSGDPLLGATPGTDARGFGRIRDGDDDSFAVVDRGATELGRPIVVDTDVDELNGLGLGAGSSLREAVDELAKKGGRILFDAALDGAIIQLLGGVGGQIAIESSMILDATNLPMSVTVSGPGLGTQSFRVFEIDGEGVQVQMRRIVIEAGSATGGLGIGSSHWGGGVRVGATSEGTLINLVECTVRGNVATTGGGLALVNGATGVVRRCTLSGNRLVEKDLWEAAGGGAIYLDGGLLKLTNSTLSGNRAGRFKGGGIATSGSDFGAPSLMRIASATIVNNESGSGGGIAQPSGSGTVISTILAHNTPDNYAGPGGLSSSGVNLESGTDAGFTAPGDRQNTDPEIGPLKMNGGSTATHALGPNSPARQAGYSDNLEARIDQRGFERARYSPDDIGAYDSGHEHCSYWAWAVETIDHIDDIQPDENPDADLMDNLAEYAQGLNPFVFDGYGGSGYPRTQLHSSGQLRMNFNRMTTAKDVVFIAEVSSDLQSWTEVYRFEDGVVMVGTGYNGFTGTAPRVRDYVHDPGAPPLMGRGFIRVGFELR